MIMANFLKTRKSVRDFKNKEVNSDKLDSVKKILEGIVEKEDLKSGIEFRLYENGKFIFENLKGISGYSGVMIKSPHYISMDLKSDEDKNMVYGGYYSEKIITELNQMGIETCWVSVNSVDETTKKKIFGEFTGNIQYLLAIGYSKARNPFIQEPFSERQGIDNFVFDREIQEFISIDDLERRGLGDIFFYIRFAPSTRNKQPWRFVLENNKVELFLHLEEGKRPLFIDAGIIMYYFEKLALYLGIKNKWILGEGVVVKEHDGEQYRYIGEYHL